MFDQLWQRVSHHQWLHKAREMVEFATRRSEEVQLRQVASSLTLTTVLSLVPVLAVALAMFAAFPLFAGYRTAFEKYLLASLLPQQFSSVVLDSLNQFASKATRLTAFGLLFLALTALVMIYTVDRAMNDIFNVRQRRPIAQRVLVYWALITLGPVIVGASVSLTSYVASASGGLIDRLPSGSDYFIDFAQIALSGGTLAVLYTFVPFTKVQWRDALLGAAIAALLAQLVRTAFTSYVTKGNATSIYGALAVLPLFLTWVYLSWLIVLFGAAITATLPMLRGTRYADDPRAGNRFVTAVGLLQVLLEATTGDVPERSSEALAVAVRTTPEDTERLLIELETLGYVHQLAGNRVGFWLMTGETARTSLAPLFERMAIDPENSLLRTPKLGLEPWIERALASDWLHEPIGKLLLPVVDAEMEQQPLMQ